MINRAVSLSIVVYCLAGFWILEGPSGAFVLIALLPILMCIWFGDLIGSITGIGGFRHPVVDRESPGCLVSAIAWVGLIALAVALSTKLF